MLGNVCPGGDQKFSPAPHEPRTAHPILHQFRVDFTFGEIPRRNTANLLTTAAAAEKLLTRP